MKTFNKETSIKLIEDVMRSFEYESISIDSNEKRILINMTSKLPNRPKETEEICIRIHAEDRSANLKYNLLLESSTVNMLSIRIRGGEITNFNMLTDNVKLPNALVNEILSVLNEE